MQPFDHLNTPLLGRNLIESSAGTGKTYAIASLYLRLLLERRLAVSQILVVTFTEAATADLKRRIRERLREAAMAFETGNALDDFLAALLKRIPAWSEARTRLEDALRMLDEAAIFTIHGFCQRVLQENAFESQSLFETEFITSHDSLVQGIVDDFWRQQFYPASALFIEYAWQKQFLPEPLCQFVRKGLATPFLTLIPQTRRPSPERLASAEAKLQETGVRLRSLWANSKDEVRCILLESEALKRSLYRRPALESALQEMERYLSSDGLLALPGHFEKFLPLNLANATKAQHCPPSHPFFEACESLQEAHSALTALFEEMLSALRLELVDYVRRQLRERKRQQNVRSFDDLLIDLYEALRGVAGRDLARALQHRYPAALIDEFQDTDPIQYAIFQTIYSDEQSSLFLIGDPKQAIYGFRGADVFAYLEAASGIGAQYTLDRNWRSQERLVQAVNSFFDGAANPFVIPEISFHPVRAARPEAAGEFLWNGNSDRAPFKVWFLSRGADVAKPMAKGFAEKLLAGAVASDVVRLLEAGGARKALVKNQPVSPADIAVLVRTNREARLVQEALRLVRVPCVLYSDASVFASREALEIERILRAISEPANEGRVRAALATDVFGVNGNELMRLVSDDAAWDERLKSFAEYRDLWASEGLMAMTAALMTRERVRVRLLRFPDGERRLTNLLHCFELLHQAALEDQLGIDGLLKYLAQARYDTNGIASEERQIRLETDERAVKVVTIHKSKGLEYPVVYCPFVWNAMSRKEDAPMFHDQGERTRVIQDIGSGKLTESQRRASLEALAENVRLLYVALTRARYRCTAAWGAIADAGSSAPAYLLHGAEAQGTGTVIENLRSYFESVDDAAIRSRLARLEHQSAGAIEVLEVPPFSSHVYVPPIGRTQPLVCRKLGRTIPQDWGVASFTSLVSGISRAAELPDRDALFSDSDPASMPGAAAGRVQAFRDFPRGTRAGTVLHEIFEQLDFSMQEPAEARKLVRDKLAEGGFDPVWQEPVLEMIRNVLATPLQEHYPALTLGSLSKQQRLHEMEFSFPLDPLTSRRLRAVFGVHRGPEVPEPFGERLEQLAFSPVRGVMKGFIDLIFEFEGRFYLLDWKSNYLGAEPEAYGQQALRAVMAREFYLLQYHLYTVALHRYLSFRLPGYRYQTDFGGVFYLFLRGIDPRYGAGFGVYYDRPSEALILDLSHCLHAT